MRSVWVIKTLPIWQRINLSGRKELTPLSLCECDSDRHWVLSYQRGTKRACSRGVSHQSDTCKSALGHCQLHHCEERIRQTHTQTSAHTHPFCTSGHCTGFYSSRKECVVYSTQAGWILKSCYMLPLRATGLGCTFSVACRHHAVVISGTQSVIKAWDGSLRGKRASAEKSKRNTFVLHWPCKFFVTTWPGHIGCLFNLHKNKKV